VMAYRRDLELYEQFLKTNKEPTLIYDFMKRRKLSTRSQARVISSLRTYFRFCESRGRKCPELRVLHPPKVKAKLPKPLTEQDFYKLLEVSQVEDPYKTARNHITLKLLFGLGCRVSELIAVNLQDVNFTERWVVVTGKGGKQRLLPLMDHLHDELRVYFSEARPRLKKDSTTSVLINDRGHRPSRVDIWRWLKAWSAAAGFESTVGPHQFRHGCATALLDSGADLRSIQLLLGHASLQTTQIYTSVSSKKIRKTVDEHHPLSQVDKDFL